MGQKVNPKVFRLGPVFNWSSRWFAKGEDYKELLMADVKLREMLSGKLKTAGLTEVEIERSINKVRVIVHVSRPGMVIGRGGSGLEELKKFIEKFFLEHKLVQPYGRIKNMQTDSKLKVELAVEPVKEPNLSAFLVAQNIADQLVRRLPHKRVCLQAIERVMNAGAKGVKIQLAGRIAGAEISRREKYKAGSIPLSTIREEVDFAAVPSLTKSGYIGVKVWVCRKTQ